jgi:hypothetical protein
MRWTSLRWSVLTRSHRRIGTGDEHPNHRSRRAGARVKASHEHVNAEKPYCGGTLLSTALPAAPCKPVSQPGVTMMNFTSHARVAALGLGLVIAAGTLAACDENTSAEKVGENIDNAIEKAGDKIEKATDEMARDDQMAKDPDPTLGQEISTSAEKAVDQAGKDAERVGDAMSDSAEKAGENASDAMRAVGEKIEEAGESMQKK